MGRCSLVVVPCPPSRFCLSRTTYARHGVMVSIVVVEPAGILTLHRPFPFSVPMRATLEESMYLAVACLAATAASAAFFPRHSSYLWGIQCCYQWESIVCVCLVQYVVPWDKKKVCQE